MSMPTIPYNISNVQAGLRLVFEFKSQANVPVITFIGFVLIGIENLLHLCLIETNNVKHKFFQRRVQIHLVNRFYYLIISLLIYILIQKYKRKIFLQLRETHTQNPVNTKFKDFFPTLLARNPMVLKQRSLPSFLCILPSFIIKISLVHINVYCVQYPQTRFHFKINLETTYLIFQSTIRVWPNKTEIRAYMCSYTAHIFQVYISTTYSATPLYIFVHYVQRACYMLCINLPSKSTANT